VNATPNVAEAGVLSSLDEAADFDNSRNMETKQAVGALAALAQEHRLSVFRMLVREGPSGLSAGDIAARVAVAPSTLSHHLGQLERAGLLRSWRVERRIFYAVDIEGTRRLVTFLTEDCCQGHPEICGYGREGGCRDDHDLPQPGVRDLAQCPGDDPELG
jgi:ArsR family transcriptional regulator, arsenate/arsenite/antimonite-responsive transcriptional repressor